MAWPGEELRLYLPISRLHVAAKAWGPKDARPILCVHGWLDNCHSFVPLVQRMLSDGRPPARVVAVDLPGHGLSEHRHPASFMEFMCDVNEIANALGWPRFTLIGHSMGAVIACIYAAAMPERVDMLVLIDALGPAQARQSAHRQIADGIRSRTLLLEKNNRTFATRLEAAKALRMKNDTMSKESALLLVERGTKPVEGGVMFRHDIQVRATSLQRYDESQIKELMQDVKCPTLVVLPDNGLIVESSASQRLKYVPHWETLQLQGGHHVHMDDADTLAKGLLPFLDSLNTSCKERPTGPALQVAMAKL